MRKLDKLNKPQILIDNEEVWLNQLRESPNSDTNKTRYRNKEIKARLKEETGNKCIYCESKIGHNTPGDIEHKKPASKFPDLIFNWDNLTIACTECNRRKNDYYSSSEQEHFVDPYIDDIENMIAHHGPVVLALPNYSRAEVSIKILELDSSLRAELIFRKIEKIKDIDERVKRMNLEQEPILKTVLKKALVDLTEKNNEYSGMVKTILNTYGVIDDA